MPEIITLGETMVAFVSKEAGPLRYMSEFRKVITGSESNVAIGLTRLGHSVGWVSRLGRDEFGFYIEKELKGEGVDTTQVIFDEGLPTGIMFKEVRSADMTNVYYYRKGSAASNMQPADIDVDYLNSARLIHLTGITPALSTGCMDTVKFLIKKARVKNKLLSFDPNIRLKLWKREQIKDSIIPMISYTDILLCGSDEGELLFDTDQPEEMLQKAFDVGAKKVVIKLGSKGALVADSMNREVIHFIDPVKVVAVDSVGAGDAFAAGFLSGYLRGLSDKECGKLGAIMGAYAVTTKGDYEGLPTKNEMERLLVNEHVSR